MRMRWDGDAVIIDSPVTGRIVWMLAPDGLAPVSFDADVRAAGLLHEIPLRDVNRVMRQVERDAGQMVTGGGLGRDAPPATIRTPPATALSEPDFVGPEP